MNKVKLAIVSCGFLGCSPIAPGTFGTLGGVLIAWALAGRAPYALWVLVAAAVVYAIGQPLGRWSEQYAGKKDPGIFVLDEVVGYLVTIAWTGGPSLLALTTAFFVFRLFDILKPWPARQMERIPGGHGILLDDVVAGVYGFLVMAAARLLLPDVSWTVGG
jgi:phosphatidylglycerophosphatase A